MISPKNMLILIKSRYVAVLLYTSGIIGNLIALTDFRISPLIFLMAVGSLSLATVSAYILSDLMDLNEDRLNSPNRPLPSGKVSVNDARTLIITSLALGVVIALTINYLTATLIFVTFILSSLYSLPFIRAKDRYYSKSLISWMGGFVGTFIASAVILKFSLLSILISSLDGFLIMLLVMIGDVIDYEGDKKAGVKSLAVTFGIEKATLAIEIVLALVIAITASILYISYNEISPMFFLISSAATFLVYKYIYSLKNSGFKRERAKLVKQALRALYFSVQISIILGFFIYFII
ncbi:MAG: UbiA prenyltransferase family protein [Nitrososphaerota archaeon]|jgi:4-hydroxybenzoate polyprenyltransferase|nr:UbiA family prenyltransferase [Nitrososphaerota archaeon]MDG6932208.1 UbiA prenyltransferase family protein [Nitrososphaerota archaeon]MDG6935799.1 UbiA prenyltransferase family protein [Nitrososphaerota archaeon]MDG6944117.1 UbiA prenyltransferase family protein [Nitrososphaerota archaeon]